MKKVEKVVLVDKNDRKIGEEEKILAHKEGKTHRAFSVFIFDSQKKLLLQKRSTTKYHSGGLWTNTCCGHPRPKELTKNAATRRLKEETDLECQLTKIFDFGYKYKFRNGLTENEFDHVYIGFSDKKPRPNTKEYSAYKYLSLSEIKKELKTKPRIYTFWFRKIFKRIQKKSIISLNHIISDT